MTLKAKEVTVNKFTREVAICIQGERMYGYVSKTQFIWDYTKWELPKMNVKENGVAAAKYGRLFILERLKADNIELDIKTKERKVPYMHLDTLDGVWMNVFANGYIRGAINNVNFAWNPYEYREAVAVNTAGFKGSITQKIDTEMIQNRIKKAGFFSVYDLVDHVIEAHNCETTVRRPRVKQEVIIEKASDKYAVVMRTEDLSVNYHGNGFVTGSVRGQEFSWTLRDGMDKLPAEVKEAFKSLNIKNMKELRERYSPILAMKTLETVNKVCSSLIQYQELREELSLIFKLGTGTDHIVYLLEDTACLIEEGDIETDRPELILKAIDEVISVCVEDLQHNSLATAI